MKETITLELEVPKEDYDRELESFLDYTLNYCDIFRHHSIGYWGKGFRVESPEGKYWLIQEHDDFTDEVDYDKIVASHLAGEELPEEFHVFDRDTATRAFNELLKRIYKKGRSLQSIDYDCDDEDVAIQYALFGKLVYG